MPLHETSPGSGLEPWRISLLPEYGGTAVQGTWAIGRDTNQTFINAYLSNAATQAQNDEVTWPLVLSAGTWRLDIDYVKGSVCGIATFRIDGTSIGTVDGYDASAALYNQSASITGISVASSGKKTFGILMATKNASASNYRFLLTAAFLTRTA